MRSDVQIYSGTPELHNLTRYKMVVIIKDKISREDHIVVVDAISCDKGCIEGSLRVKTHDTEYLIPVRSTEYVEIQYGEV